MDFPTEIDGLVITRDSRAGARGRTKPTKISVTHKAGTRIEVLQTAFRQKNPPFALVDADGIVHIVSAGGSGAIWTHGDSTDAQDDAVAILTEAMTKAFGIKPAKKKAAAAKVDPLDKFADLPVSEPRAWDSYGVGPDPF